MSPVCRHARSGTLTDLRPGRRNGESKCASRALSGHQAGKTARKRPGWPVSRGDGCRHFLRTFVALPWAEGWVPLPKRRARGNSGNCGTFAGLPSPSFEGLSLCSGLCQRQGRALEKAHTTLAFSRQPLCFSVCVPWNVREYSYFSRSPRLIFCSHQDSRRI